MFSPLLTLAKHLQATRLPSQCHVCHAWPSDPLCEACVHQFAQPVPRCPRCALPLPAGAACCGTCLQHPPALDQCLAAVSYAYPWDGLIHAFKFRGETGLAHSLATLMRATPWAEDLLEHADLVVPLPLSDARLRERGYNQALLLARQLAPQTTRTDILRKVRDTAPLHELQRSERLNALEHAFAVAPMQVVQLTGRQVVLVDDVMTTGTTLNTAARVLKANGAACVSAVVLARTD